MSPRALKVAATCGAVVVGCGLITLLFMMVRNPAVSVSFRGYTNALGTAERLARFSVTNHGAGVLRLSTFGILQPGGTEAFKIDNKAFGGSSQVRLVVTNSVEFLVIAPEPIHPWRLLLTYAPGSACPTTTEVALTRLYYDWVHDTWFGRRLSYRLKPGHEELVQSDWITQ